MDITYAEVKKIFDTCPIGYYLGNSLVDVSLDEKSQNSYYSPHKNQIIVSYPFIAQNAEQVQNDGMDLEQIIRTLVYHELSHAILTPKEIGVSWDRELQDRVNIVEDERIERIMKDFYMNVNFKQFIKSVIENQHLDYSNPNTFKGKSGLILCARIGIGTKEMLEDLNKILCDYKNMNNTNQKKDVWGYNLDYYYDTETRTYRYYKDYINRIDAFYKKYFESPSEEQQQEMLKQLMDMLQGDEEGEEQQIPMGEKGEESEEKADQECEISEEDNGDGMGFTPEKIRAITKSILSKGLNGELLEQLKAIFERTNIVEKMTSGATNGYSGVFNPRAVMRKDYKFFIHQDNKGDSKGFSKLHLNLFIDVSGSFSYNTDITNQLLNCLTQVEKSNPNFSYDLITINTKAELKKPKEKWIRCCGGNQLPLYLKDLYHKAYRYDCVNYNVLLFDGDCLSDVYYEDKRREQLKNFVNLFDIKSTSIISDPSNQRYFNKFKTAQVIYCRDYVEELTKKVVEVLKVAFM